MPTAIKISGRKADARFSFINDQYEPMQITHNDKPCFVARAVCPRYLFHNGQSRWCVSKVLDDGFKCWAYVKASANAQDPSDSTGSWGVCDHDGTWREDAAIQVAPVPASTDKFVQLRMTLDADMRKYGLIEKTDLKKMWRRLDYNGNNIVSLAEIDKMVVELVSGGIWPAWLNNKPALMRAYKKTILKDGDGDSWVQKREFHALLLNIFWFNKLWQIYEQVDSGADRRIDVREFTSGMSKLGLSLSDSEAQAEFGKIDGNGGGQVLFVEFCAYIRNRVNPDHQAEFDADIVSGEHCGRASYNKVHHKGTHAHHAHHAAHHAGHHHLGHFTHHTQSRGLDFSAMSASGGGGGDGGYGDSTGGGGMYGGATGGYPSSGVERTGPVDTLRKMGDKPHTATREHVYKQKCFSDFDQLEDKIKAQCKDHAKLRGMWHTLDFNGNGIVSLAEIDKWAVEQYPLLNHKPALMRCYKCTIANGSHHDDWVHSKDFKKMIVNLFYFNKLYWVFDECNGDDRRMTLPEFKQCLALCKCQISEAEAARDFQSCDKNGGGMVLFDEFCHYFASKMCPQGFTEFTTDGYDRSGKDGTASVLRNAHHSSHNPIRHHGHSRYT